MEALASCDHINLPADFLGKEVSNITNAADEYLIIVGKPQERLEIWFWVLAIDDRFGAVSK